MWAPWNKLKFLYWHPKYQWNLHATSCTVRIPWLLHLAVIPMKSLQWFPLVSYLVRLVKTDRYTGWRVEPIISWANHKVFWNRESDVDGWVRWSLPFWFPRGSQWQVVPLSFQFLASSLLLILINALPPFVVSCWSFLKPLHHHLFLSIILGALSSSSLQGSSLRRGACFATGGNGAGKRWCSWTKLQPGWFGSHHEEAQQASV